MLKQLIEKKENNQSCPKCGEAMILREVKNGQNIGNKFWGVQTSQNVETEYILHNKCF